jgi:hypothetical protein
MLIYLRKVGMRRLEPPRRSDFKDGVTSERASSPSRLSINAKTPFDELRVSGKNPLKSNPQPLRLSLSKPRFGENRQSPSRRGMR